MIPRKDLAAVLLRLRGLLARGSTLREASLELGLKPTFVHKLAARRRMPRRRRAMPAAKRKRLRVLVEGAKLTLSQIAKRLQLSKGTVCKHRQTITEGRTKYRPRRLRKPVRCPNGHKVTELPCRTCQARGE